jgi:hypothetical protein
MYREIKSFPFSNQFFIIGNSNNYFLNILQENSIAVRPFGKRIPSTCSRNFEKFENQSFRQSKYTFNFFFDYSIVILELKRRNTDN